MTRQPDDILDEVSLLLDGHKRDGDFPNPDGTITTRRHNAQVIVNGVPIRVSYEMKWTPSRTPPMPGKLDWHPVNDRDADE